MSKNFENGIIGTDESGSSDISDDIEITGVVYWVDSVNGNDANAGTNRVEPKATTASAVSAATANNGDIIIWESGHTETSANAITLSKAGIKFFGLGSGSNKPTFIVSGNVDLFDVTGERCEINNIRFTQGTAAHTARINANAVGIRIVNCDFLCGANDLHSITVPDAADDVEINGCTFEITANGPDEAIIIESATALGVKIIGCQFDGGDFDFDNAAIYSAVAHTEFLYRGNVLLNLSSIIHTAASKGLCIGTIAGDGSKVQI